jgi:hypothetical protein
MMLEWKPYLNERLIAQHPAGFSVIRPIEASEAQPLFCPMCESIMRSSYDDEAYKKFSCCDECSNTWVYPNLSRWNEGWRPSDEEIQNNCRKSPI